MANITEDPSHTRARERSSLLHARTKVGRLSELAHPPRRDGMGLRTGGDQRRWREGGRRIGSEAHVEEDAPAQHTERRVLGGRTARQATFYLSDCASLGLVMAKWTASFQR